MKLIDARGLSIVQKLSPFGLKSSVISDQSSVVDEPSALEVIKACGLFGGRGASRADWEDQVPNPA